MTQVPGVRPFDELDLADQARYSGGLKRITERWFVMRPDSSDSMTSITTDRS